jgi:hypothetical protein
MQSGIVLRAGARAYYLLRPDGRSRQNKYLPMCARIVCKKSARRLVFTQREWAILLCFVDSALARSRKRASANILFLLTWLFIH